MKSLINSKTFLKAYEIMYLSRIFEEKLASLYRSGKVVGGVYLGKGQEAFSSSMGIFLDNKKGDVFAPLIRDQAGRIAFGENIKDAIRTYLGSPLGPMRGRDGNVHRGRPKDGVVPMISHLGSSISVVNGMLLAKKIRKENRCVGLASIGDGGTSTGAFHEALNQASVEKLPLVLGIANNQFAYSTPISKQFACKSLVDKAIGYGVEGYEVDGTSLEECLNVFKKAILRAREGKGPQMIVGNMLRLTGHGEHDDANYVPEKLKLNKKFQDCLILAKDQALNRNDTFKTTLDDIEKKCYSKLDKALKEVQLEEPFKFEEEDWSAISTKF